MLKLACHCRTVTLSVACVILPRFKMSYITSGLALTMLGMGLTMKASAPQR